MRRLVPLLAAVVAANPAPASAEVVPNAPTEATLAVAENGTPFVGYVRFGSAFVARRDATGWRGVFGSPRLPGGDAVVRAVLPEIRLGRSGAGPALLVQDRAGAWLRLVLRARGRPLALSVRTAPKGTSLGLAGATLDRNGRPVVAYSLRGVRDQTELWLVRYQPRANGTLFAARTRVTRRGFPNSLVPPSAQPVLMPDGSIRVVQSYTERGARAIFWRREGARWWGRVLFASTLGATGLPLFAALGGDDLHLAWTVAYAPQRELHVLHTSRTTRSQSVVLHRRAIAAGLALGPNGPEVAANEDVDGLTAGLVFFPAIIPIRATPPVELDGKIVSYTRDRVGRWHVLLERNDMLEWFAAPAAPSVRIFVEGPLSGRVEGATGGVVRVYRERPGVARELVAEVPVDASGRFAAADPAPVSGARYRIVYEREVPYALLVREPVP